MGNTGAGCHIWCCVTVAIANEPDSWASQAGVVMNAVANARVCCVLVAIGLTPEFIKQFVAGFYLDWMAQLHALIVSLQRLATTIVTIRSLWM